LNTGFNNGFGLNTGFVGGFNGLNAGFAAPAVAAAAPADGN